MNNTQPDTPAKQDNAQVTDPVKKDFWQVVTDILDNPFIQPCERDGALLEHGYRVILSTG